MIRKEYYLKVFNKTGTTLLSTVRDFSFDSFIQRIGGGVGELVLSIPVATENVDENVIYGLNHRVDMYVKDAQLPNGKRIYSGYIETSEYNADGKNQTFKVHCVGHFTKMAQYPVYRRTADFEGTSPIYTDTGGVTEMKTDTNRGIRGDIAGGAATIEASKAIQAVADYYLANAANPQVSYYDKVELVNSYLFTDPAYKQYLKAYWRFENDLLDSSGNSHTLTDMGGKATGGAFTPDVTALDATAYKPTGYCGQAYYEFYYDWWSGLGATDHADFKPTTGDFTISATVKTIDYTVVAGVIFSSRNYSGAVDKGWSLFSEANTGEATVRILNGTTTQNVVSTKRIDDGKWHQIVFCKKGSNYYLYLDGELEKVAAVVTTPTYHATNFVAVGSFETTDLGITNTFNGFIDETFIYNGYGFTSADVKSLWKDKTIAFAGNSLTYTWESQTSKQIIDTVMQYVPSTWYYYVNADNKLVLDEKKHTTSVPYADFTGVTTHPHYWNFDADKIVNRGGVFAYPYDLANSAATSTADVVQLFNGPAAGAGRFNDGFAGDGSSRYGSWTSTDDVYKISRLDVPRAMGCWFKLNNVIKATATGHGLFQFWDLGGGISNGFRMFVGTTGKLTVTVGDGIAEGGDTQIGPVLEPNTWYFVVATIELESFSAQSGRVRVYLNGQLISNAVVSVGNAANNPTYKRIGCLNDSGSNAYFIDGNIDDVFVQDTTLTQSQIWQMYYDNVATHNLVYGDSVKSLSFNRSMKELINNYLFAGTAIYNNYYDVGSQPDGSSGIIDFDEFWAIESDTRVTDTTTARNKGESTIVSSKIPKFIISVTVLDNAYDPRGHDIESFNIGDSVKITNLARIGKTNLNKEVFMIVGITYAKTYAVLELATIDQLLSTEVARLKTINAQETNSTNPTSFGLVSINQ